MSERANNLLERLSAEIANLGAQVVPSTAIVTGQLKDFSDASGSAWLFDRLHLVTNFHVVDGLEMPIQVRMPGHPEITVSLTATDPLTDLAVLKLPEPVAEKLELREDPARLGELCFAFGSPLGEFPESMTMGVISGVNRRIMSPGGRMIEGVLQTDAAISNGNSGGPLVDASGFVLGMNSQGRDDGQNIGFAVPADTILYVVSELLEHHEVVRPSLGLSVASTFVIVNGQLQERLKVVAVRENATGTFQPDDVLLSIGGHDVRTRADLLRILRRDMVDTVTQVEVLRAEVVTSLNCRPARLADD